MDKKIAIFDFDGTISTIDSTKFFLKDSFGIIYFIYGYYIRFIHLYIFSKVGLYDFIKLKEMRITFFLRNISIKKFDHLVKKFNKKFFKEHLKRSALNRLDWHKKKNHRIIILSATLQPLLTKWSNANGYTLIANGLISKNDTLTGSFERPDCSYDEKVNRLKEIIDLDNFNYLYGYGDTKSDYSFLDIVDEPYFQYFKV